MLPSLNKGFIIIIIIMIIIIIIIIIHFVLSLQSAFVLQPYLLFGQNNKYDNWLTNTLLQVVSHKRTATSKPKKARLSFSYNTIFIATLNASE